MVGYDNDNNALTLGDDDSLSVGDYELEYNSTEDQWQARYGQPIGGEAGAHGEILSEYQYSNDSNVGNHAINNYAGAGGITVPHQSKFNVSNITITGWIKTDKTFGDMSNRWPELAAKDGGASGDVFSFGAINDLDEDIAIRLFDTSDANYEAIYTSSFAGTDTWTHIAATYDGSTIRVYEDGVEQASNAVSFTLRTNTEEIELVKNLEGLVDDIRIYDRALSSTELSNLVSGTDITSGLVSQWNFEYPETPSVAIDSTGDVYPKNSVARSASGSLVPSGLAEFVSAGEALADDGNTYTSVQNAVDAASGWVFVGPGTFNESVTISTAGLTLEGSGYDTLINGGTTGDAITINASEVSIRTLSVRTTAGAGNNYDGVSFGSNTTADSVRVRESDRHGFLLDVNARIYNCNITSTDSNAIQGPGHSTGLTGQIIVGCAITNTSNAGIYINSDDAIIANNIIDNTAEDGIAMLEDDDNIIIGNRVSNAGDRGIDVNGVDNIAANNRVSDSTNSDIRDGGTGTLLDGNLTGASN